MQSFRMIVYDVLKNAGRPMHVSEITKEVNKIKQIKSKTPANTINLACQKHDKIKRVDRGTFLAVK
mgnify:CR=1 FL=1